ncbi:hypothetical protein CYMTET_2613 [Cymbomonas tetramitiformis]|uniref:Uncharacterized protein n=1 Tax=Cymbomonas tetramitiformis TaxID=36881 RepID=A0AAE0CD13_9CHLO|nr:hypothetical protein CYMTET_38989 [Cymbomonas tetramitiformis]KAK3290010.1 hypothetical protein CYMTET_2613 [Cymbomonas tetramitiformis]|eukprot:gene26853-33010_t
MWETFKNEDVHLLATTIFVVQLATLLVRSDPGSVQLHVQYAKYSDNGNTLRIDRMNSLDFDTVILMIVFFTISAILHAYRYVEFKTQNGIAYSMRVSWWRWADYVITAPTMIVVVGISVGIFDICELLTLYAVMTATVSFGIIAEFMHRSAVKLNLKKHEDRNDISLFPIQSAVSFGVVTVAIASFLVITLFVADRVVDVDLSHRLQYVSYVSVFALAYTYFWSIAISELQNNMKMPASKSSKTMTEKTVVFIFAFVPYMIMWASIFVRFGIAVNQADGDVPNSVYCIVVVMFVGFTGSFPIILACEMYLDTVDRNLAELLYTTAGVANKVALGWFMQMGVERAQNAS